MLPPVGVGYLIVTDVGADTVSPNGNLLERLHRNPDGSCWSTICHYDQSQAIRLSEGIVVATTMSSTAFSGYLAFIIPK
jgi:hypothetical protein